MKSQLERAISIAARTGDKVIVVDELNDRSSVIMNLDEYELLLNGQNKGNGGLENLTEEELLDKINRDIVTWKDANSDKKFFEDVEAEDAFDGGEDDFIEDENDEIIPDYTAPGFNASMTAEADMIPEPVEPEVKEEKEIEAVAETEKEVEKIPDLPVENLPVENEVEKAEEVAIPAPAEVPAEGDEDVYYYHEPEKVEVETQPEPEPPAPAPVKKEEGGFTSLKDELKKNRKAWAIPEEVKEKAEDLKS